MRQAMRDLRLEPDVVLVSTARRTMETLEALEPWEDTPLIEPMDSLYLANPMQLTAALHSVAETVRSVLLIGHNPGMHDLALGLFDQDSEGDPGAKEPRRLRRAAARDLPFCQDLQKGPVGVAAGLLFAAVRLVCRDGSPGKHLAALLPAG